MHRIARLDRILGRARTGPRLHLARAVRLPLRVVRLSLRALLLAAAASLGPAFSAGPAAAQTLTIPEYRELLLSQETILARLDREIASANARHCMCFIVGCYFGKTASCRASCEEERETRRRKEFCSNSLSGR